MFACPNTQDAPQPNCVTKCLSARHGNEFWRLMRSELICVNDHPSSGRYVIVSSVMWDTAGVIQVGLLYLLTCSTLHAWAQLVARSLATSSDLLR